MRAALYNKFVLILALAGMVVAGTLTYTKLLNVIVPCGVGDGCKAVSNHPSSEWMGIPVAAYGLAAYVVLALIAAYRILKGIPETRGLGLVGYFGSMVGAIVSIGLQIYSGSVIKAYCTWCIVSAVIMVLLFIAQAMLYQAQSDTTQPSTPRRAKGDLTFLVAASLLGIGAMVTSGMVAKANGSTGVRKFAAEEVAPRLVPDGINYLGAADAPITIVEFGDLCCPACHKAFALMKDVLRAHDGKIKFVFRHLPLINMHKEAYRAAVYAEYAGTEGKFWQFVEAANQTDPEEVDNKENLENLLLGIGLDPSKASEAYNNEKSAEFDRVYRDFTLANDLGIVSTPTFYVVVKGERPFAMQISDILQLFDSDPKYRKLLGKS